VPTVPNCITAAIARKQADLDAGLVAGKFTAEQVEATRKALDMEADEFVKFQELKSIACLQGKLTTDEGQTIYALLGNTPSVFNRRDAATKIVLTKIFEELLKASM